MNSDGELSVEYLDNISGKNLKGITRERTSKWFGRYFWGRKYLENYQWNIWTIFLERTWRGSLGKYVGSISGKNLKGVTGENICRIFWGGF
jgi:hypothetical protein